MPIFGRFSNFCVYRKCAGNKARRILRQSEGAVSVCVAQSSQERAPSGYDFGSVVLKATEKHYWLVGQILDREVAIPLPFAWLGSPFCTVIPNFHDTLIEWTSCAKTENIRISE
jgi:hypothetical protein